MPKLKNISDPIIFESTFEKYKAVEMLGGNNTAWTFKCEDDLGNHWAVKLLNPRKATRQKISRFKKELTFCLRNTHPNIVTVVDHGLYKGPDGASPFYVTPLYAESLRSMVREGIQPERVLPYFSQLLDGIESVHSQGHHHLNLKPENIFYDPSSGILSIGDFGMSNFKDMKKFTAFERRKTRIAECQYAAPEQHAAGEADAGSDIYSLGLILKEMFTREMPHRSLKTIQSAAPDHAYLDYLAARMTRRKSRERPPSISAIKSELIGRRKEFITRQRLSELKEVAIPEFSIDDSLISDPPRIVDYDYVRGRLILTFSRPVNQRWVWTFKHMSKFSYPLGYHPARFSISGDKAEVDADVRVIGEVMNYVRGWLKITNQEYEETVTQTALKEYEKSREELKEEIEEQQRRLEVFQTVRMTG